jgi:hypothetical protein
VLRVCRVHVVAGDYPYAAEFIAPMPAWPVNVTCSFWSNTTMDDLARVHASRLTVDLFYNFTGQAGSCHNLTDEQGLATLGAGNQWPYQSCAEMVMPIGQYGPPNDLFYPAPWNYTETVASCQQQFGITPQRTWIATQFGGGPADWSDATNIVFSNGNLDPWSGGGVVRNISDTVVAIPVVGGAHHLDLRASDPRDPPGVIWARQQEVQWIKNFLANPSPANPPPQIVYNNTVIYNNSVVIDTVYVYLNETASTSGLTKTSVALISVFSTLGAAILAVGAYAYCMRKPAQSLVDVDTHTGGDSYNSMGH